jgi:hypothetical protein
MSPSESVCFTVNAIPPSMNDLIGASYAKLRGFKKKWAKFIGEQIQVTRQRKLLVAWLETGCRVRFEMTVHHSKECDEDNLQSMTKIPLDVLVSKKRLYLLRGDSPREIDRRPVVEMKSTRKEAKTVFRITKVE